MIAFIVAVRYYVTKQAAARHRQRVKEESFLVPKEGGVLQKMSKDQDGNIKLRLGKKIKLTSDTYIFRFSFNDPDHSFGLPIGQHVILSANIKTKEAP